MSKESLKSELRLSYEKDGPEKFNHVNADIAHESKKLAIREACVNKDIDELVRWANSPGGLLDDSLRQTACTCCNSILQIGQISNAG